MTAARGASRYLAAALILALMALLGAAGPAAAQVLPLPLNPTDPLPVPVVPPSGSATPPAQHGCSPYPLCLVVPNDPGPQTPPSLDHPDPELPILPLRDDPGHHAHVNDLFNIDDGYGRDLRNYDLFANLPWLVSNPMPAIWLWLANLGFAVGKYALGISVWFTEWSMTAGVFDWVKAPAQDLEQIWQTSIIGGLKLRQLALLIATCYLGLLFVRGRTTRAWRELFSTIAINVAAIAIITHPVDFLVGDGGVLSLSRDLGTDVSAVIMGNQPGGTGNPAAPIGQAMNGSAEGSSPIRSHPNVGRVVGCRALGGAMSCYVLVFVDGRSADPVGRLVASAGAGGRSCCGCWGRSSLTGRRRRWHRPGSVWFSQCWRSMWGGWCRRRR